MNRRAPGRLVKVCLGVLAAACHISGSQTIGEDSDAVSNATRAVADDFSVASEAIFATLDEDILLFTAPAAAIATVIAIDGPFWNQADGQKWEASELVGGDYTVPVLYREISLDVDRFLWNELGLETNRLIIRVLGGGKDQIGGDPFIGGHFEQGESVLILLRSDVFYMRELPVEFLQPYYNRQGVYHLVQREGESVVVPDAYFVDDAAQEVPLDSDDAAAEFDPQSLTISEFLSRVDHLRNEARPSWDRYRPVPNAAAAKIEHILQVIDAAREGSGP